MHFRCLVYAKHTINTNFLHPLHLILLVLLHNSVFLWIKKHREEWKTLKEKGTHPLPLPGRNHCQVSSSSQGYSYTSKLS